MRILHITVSVLLGLSLPSWAQLTAADCQPQAQGSAELKEIRPRYYTVTGTLGGFDPCHSSVEFKRPNSAQPAPLVLAVHGGGGIKDVHNISRALGNAGFATLIFDAYTMQGLPSRESVFWARSLTNESRQRMIWATALGAYQWAITRTDIDASRIYLYGISNGATMVANLAAVVSPAHVKGAIAEGLTPIGLGLPNTLQVPLLAIFGKLDDFGSTNPSIMRWDLTEPCRFNIQAPSLPAGTSQTCSRTAPSGTMPSALQWLESVRSQGSVVQIEYIEQVAHCGFCMPLRLGRATWANGQTMGASLGASDAGRQALLQSMREFMQRNGL